MEISITGTDSMVNMFNELVNRQRHLRIPLQRTGDFLQKSFRREYKTKGGRRWAPLAPSTVKQKARMGYPPGRPLIATGKMYHATRMIRIGSDYVDTGVENIEYYKYHHWRTRFMPARKVVKIWKRTISKIRAIWETWLLRRISS